MDRKYKWEVRQELVKHLRYTMPTRPIDDDRLVERLTDLSRSGSWLASEARAAIHETSDAQWNQLQKDVDR